MTEPSPADSRVKATRRQLKFDSLDQVMPEVERLLAGHVTVGRWSLAQILNHLAQTIQVSMDGGPDKYSWAVRRLVGPLLRRLSLWFNWIPAGVRAPKMYLPRPGGAADKEAEALRAAMARFASHPGPFDEHPLFGRMTGAQWRRFHCVHCAHHLSFALPEGVRTA